MITKLDPILWQKVKYGTPAERDHICRQSFAYFAIYYFSEYFTYKPASFHWDFFYDCQRLVNGKLREAAWIAFRESAKTSIAKMFATWCIVYRKKQYIAWDSYDGANAESALFDLTVNLQTNPKILRDYGRLYRKRKAQKTKQELEEDAPEMKRVDAFITTNKVKVEAFTTQESARGRITGKQRPDLFVFDDVENTITKNSLALTQKIIAHIDEVNSGLQNTGSILYLGNYITEEGVIAHVMERLSNKEGKIVRNIPVERKGVISWADKYVMTNEEALRKNVMIENREEHKISLEQKKADLGDVVYNTEMKNDPGKSGDYYFDRQRVRDAIDKLLASEREPVKEVGGFKIWETYNPTHRYGGGADTAAGLGGDSNASVFYNFSTTPNRVVGTYKSNEITPSAFGSGLAKQGRMFGECYLIPEINNTGYATVSKLIEEKYWNMYVREVKNKTTQKLQKEYGYNTNESNKYEVAGEFKDAWQAGQIEVLDIDLLYEMYHFTNQDLKGLSRSSASAGLGTRHFDLLKAAFLGWESRRFATVSAEEKKNLYKAPKREPYQA